MPPESTPQSSTEVLPAVQGQQGAELATQSISIAGHPRAARMVRRSREAAGLGGFLVAGWMSMSGNSVAGTLLRAIIAGAVCQVIVWAAAVVLCRHLISAELHSREHELLRAAGRTREDVGAPNPALAAAAAARGAQR